MIRKTDSSRATTLGGALDTFKYDTLGELTGYTAKYKAGVTITTLDAVATRATRMEGSAQRRKQSVARKPPITYTYDQAGRLATVKKNGAAFSSYTYDSNSNRLSATTSSGTVTGTYDAQDRLLTYGNASFTYTRTANWRVRRSAPDDDLQLRRAGELDCGDLAQRYKDHLYRRR